MKNTKRHNSVLERTIGGSLEFRISSAVISKGYGSKENGMGDNKQNKIGKWKKIANWFLFITLILSIPYIIVKVILAPAEVTTEYTKVKSDYVLMLVQCLLGLVVMMVPKIIERKRSIDIPDVMEILYVVFLYCAIFLGEVRDFYYLVPHWDTVLHAFSAAMLGVIGFTLVDLLNETEQARLRLSPFFVALFAFCFALTVGCLWEIYEYTFDGILSLNMQKYKLADGTQLVGREALSDTMKDIIVDALSALVISIIGYQSIRKREKKRN